MRILSMLLLATSAICFAQDAPTIPSGTAITIRLTDAVDSKGAEPGREYQAAVDEPVEIDGNVVIEKGTPATVRLAEVKQAGTFSGRPEVMLTLSSVTVNGHRVDVQTGDSVTQGGSQGKRSAAKILGGAAAGAVIGGIAGGGKGAAIGSGVGAGAGTVAQVATKGQRVKIPAETRLTFTLQSPATLQNPAQL